MLRTLVFCTLKSFPGVISMSFPCHFPFCQSCNWSSSYRKTWGFSLAPTQRVIPGFKQQPFMRKRQHHPISGGNMWCVSELSRENSVFGSAVVVICWHYIAGLHASLMGKLMEIVYACLHISPIKGCNVWLCCLMRIYNKATWVKNCW